MVLFLLSCYALTFILVEAEIFTPIRNILERLKFLEKLLSCWFCSGFWASAFVYSVLILPFNIPTPSPHFPFKVTASIFLHALAGAASTYIIASYLSPGILSEPMENEQQGQAIPDLDSNSNSDPKQS